MKRYRLVFTCMSSRAVHLELLDDLTTDAFLNALRTLVAIRGPARQIRCDNGTNLVGAAAELAKNRSVHDAMCIEFVFNPSLCQPHGWRLRTPDQNSTISTKTPLEKAWWEVLHLNSENNHVRDYGDHQQRPTNHCH